MSIGTGRGGDDSYSLWFSNRVAILAYANGPVSALEQAEEAREMTAEDRMVRAFWKVLILAAFVLVMLTIALTKAFAHDHDQPVYDQWYDTLMMPDNPSVRCCGREDEYRCDAFVRDGETWCRVTDDRVIPGRPVVAIGTEIFIPRHKYKYDQGNPTGHTLVFGRPSGDDFTVYCFVQSGGV